MSGGTPSRAGAAPVEIRAATPDDAATLTRLGARLFEQAFGADNTADDMRTYLASAFTEERQRLELEDPGSRVWVALAPGTEEPIGYAHVRRAPGPEGVRARRPSELARFYVDGAWHGRGVADALMDACLAEAEAWGCDGVWLGVWQTNTRAIRFYERRGFRKVGTQTFTLGRDVQKDWVMERVSATP